MSYRFGTVLVDPGDEWGGFDGVKTVLLTHAHFDHIYGLNRLVDMNPEVLICTNEYGLEALRDPKKNMSRYHDTPFLLSSNANVVVVGDGQEITIGHGTVAKAVFTPGHNPSCITWIIDDRVFSGDSLIPGVKTVTNLPGGDKALSMKSEETIKQFAINRILYSGHKI